MQILVKPGESCRDENVLCTGNSHCDGGVCTCYSGYVIKNDFCILSRTGWFQTGTLKLFKGWLKKCTFVIFVRGNFFQKINSRGQWCSYGGGGVSGSQITKVHNF